MEEEKKGEEQPQQEPTPEQTAEAMDSLAKAFPEGEPKSEEGDAKPDEPKLAPSAIASVNLALYDDDKGTVKWDFVNVDRLGAAKMMRAAADSILAGPVKPKEVTGKE